MQKLRKARPGRVWLLLISVSISDPPNLRHLAFLRDELTERHLDESKDKKDHTRPKTVTAVEKRAPEVDQLDGSTAAELPAKSESISQVNTEQGHVRSKNATCSQDLLEGLKDGTA